jgi:glucose/mannose-6-phosphate isomerase
MENWMNEAEAATPHSPDAEDMLGAVRGLPDQLAAAWARSRDITLPERCRAPRAVIVAGMGGSAIGGDLLAGALGAQLTAPLQVVRDYRLPAWVGEHSLVLASSFSGNTEETLSLWDEAGHRQAARVALTTGGRLTERASEAGAPIVTLPKGGAPRAALGHSLAGLLGALSAAGAAEGPWDEEVGAAVSQMRTVVAAEEGTATIAKALRHRLVLVYAPEHLAGVARRWKAQLNENAKTTALWDTLPELHHNSVVGLPRPAVLPDHATVVLLDGPGTHPRVKQRIDLTRTLLDAQHIPHLTVLAPEETAGRSGLAEALWLVQLGDLVSVRLAALHGVDPTPIEVLDQLKANLAQD